MIILNIIGKNKNIMAFFEAHYDNICLGCEKNLCGWCIWRDNSIINATLTSNFNNSNKTEIEN